MINDHYQPVITHFLVHTQPNLRHRMGKEKCLGLMGGANSKAYGNLGHNLRRAKWSWCKTHKKGCAVINGT